MVDRREIQQALDQIAREDVPARSVDLWAAIQAQVEAEDKANDQQRGMWLLRSSQMAAAVLLAVIVGVGTLITLWMISSRMANVGVNPSGPVEVAALYTDLNMTQVRDDVTVTVERAYADTNLVVIDTHYALASRTIDAGAYIATPGLTTFDGVALPPTFAAGSGVYLDAPRQSRYTFDTSALNVLSGDVELIFEVRLEREDPINGGGGGLMPEQGGSAWEQRDLLPLEREIVFTFMFTLPVIPVLVIEDIPAQTIDNISVSLDQLRISPSQTEMVLCMDVPDPDLDWVPVLTMTDGDRFNQTIVLYQTTRAAGSRLCAEGVYVLPYVPGQAAEWTVTVHFLRSSFADTAINAFRLEQILADRGIQARIEANDTGEPVLMMRGSMQTSKTAATVYDLTVEDALADLGQRADGPWTFTIAVE